MYNHQNSIISYMERLPKITRWIILSNIVILLLDYVLRRTGVYLVSSCGLYSWTSPNFRAWQLLTYMFLHADFWHLFCNMFAVFMFAPQLEMRWGEKRFSIYYLVSGVGAGLVQQLVWMLSSASAYSVTVGASGAVFGILFAFGWLFPEVKMFLLFVPIPISARVFVSLYALFELWQGVTPTAGDNVAHFAHLGGMLFGWLLILYWKHKGVAGMQAGYYDSKLKRWLQDWWGKIKSKFKKDSSSSYSSYHYQDPISDAQSSEDKESKEDEDEINRILDKIKLSGYSSLTEEEKQRLFKKK